MASAPLHSELEVQDLNFEVFAASPVARNLIVAALASVVAIEMAVIDIET